MQGLSIDIKRHFSSLKIRSLDGQRYVWCPVRQKNLLIQPEEMVRQCWIQELIQHHDVSLKLIQVEKQFSQKEVLKRYDIAVFNNAGKAILLVECKTFTETINDKTFLQISDYNRYLQVPYLLVSNGIDHYICHIDFKEKKYSFLDTFPKIEQQVRP